MDLIVYVTRFEVFRTPAFFLPSPLTQPRSMFAYPPGAAIVYKFLYRSHHSHLVYNSLFVLWCGSLVLVTAYVLLKKRSALSLGVAISGCTLAVLNYPQWFLFERSNIELFLWILLFASMVAYSRGHRNLAAIGIGLAASVKLYPILLLGLMLHRRREWPAIGVGVGTAVLATVVEIRLCAPGFFLFAARGFFGGVSQFQAKYAGTNQTTTAQFDHSLLQWVKAVAAHPGIPASALTTPYYVIFGLLALVIYVVRLRDKPFVNRLTFLTVLMVLLPPVSFTYTLVHLYLPLLLLYPLVLGPGSRSRQQQISMLMSLGCFLALLLPTDLLGPLYLYSGRAQAAILVLLLWSASWKPWTGPEEFERKEGLGSQYPTLLRAQSISDRLA